MAPRKRRKRGSIYEPPSGSYRVTVSAGTDPLTGRTRQLRETHGSHAAAERAVTRLHRQVDEDQELAVARTFAASTAHRAIATLKAEGLVKVARGRRAVVSGAAGE